MPEWEKTYRIYVDFRQTKHGVDDVVCVEVMDGRRVYNLKQVVYHSPTGMQSGYGGSGPADLALTILTDYFGERPVVVLKAIKGGYTRIKPSKAAKYYQLFKQFSAINHTKLCRIVVSNAGRVQLPDPDGAVMEFVITEAEIRDIIQNLEQ